MQVALKTVLADFSTKEVIRMIGCKAERATMQQGPQGKIQGKFADGSLETLVYNNKILDAKCLKRPACKRPAAAVSKKPAAACPVPLPAAADEDTEEELSEGDEGEDLEEGEEEEEAEEEDLETEEEVVAVPPPLPAVPAIPEDCSDCN